jgi:hypothetical protein
MKHSRFSTVLAVLGVTFHLAVAQLQPLPDAQVTTGGLVALPGGDGAAEQTDVASGKDVSSILGSVTFIYMLGYFTTEHC